jgi:hypothetical protein
VGFRADAGSRRLVNAMGDELRKAAVWADHTEGAVPCADEFAGGADDVVQRCREAEVLRDGQDRVEQSAQALLGAA